VQKLSVAADLAQAGEGRQHIGSAVFLEFFPGEEQRAKRVEAFSSSPEPAVFLLSLKAAGTGLTLTKADYVFLYDPWWNPAVERQAIDRTHRIGQDKTVIAYKLIVQDSVEEKVLALVEKKRELFNAVMDGAQEHAASSRLSLVELKELLR